MGKDGINIVVQSLLAEGVEQDEAVDVASYLLKDMCFIFEFPDRQAPVSFAALSSEPISDPNTCRRTGEPFADHWWHVHSAFISRR